jgi:general L-amino acid transport system permease protein
MAYADEAPKPAFRLSMLIYDTRYRSLTIQLIVLILVGLAISWLLGNVVTNLEAKGRTFDFGFLWNRSGYDINQTLIPYTNDSTHGRALLVGLVNTLVVAALGCFLATILGIIIGVLRLSNNWLIARITTIYVEVFRNVPLLLWILLAFVILTETTPAPRDFRITDEMIAAGEQPAASMLFNQSVAITNRGMNVPAPLFDRSLGSIGLGEFQLSLNFLTILGVIALSVWTNRRILRRAKAIQEDTGVRPVTWWKSLAILIVPLVAVLLLLGFHLEYPTMTRFNFSGGLELLHSFTALLIALVLYTAAFIAEIVRAGIQAIPRGQSEAAYALGLSPGRTMNLVILPQAQRVVIPPLISQYLNLTKNTSLAIAVSYMDLRGTLGGITLNQTGKELECMLLMMLIYLTISLMISSVMNIYNASIKLKER